MNFPKKVEPMRLGGLHRCTEFDADRKKKPTFYGEKVQAGPQWKPIYMLIVEKNLRTESA